MKRESIYNKFKLDFEEKYGLYYREYKHAMVLFDLFLQNYERENKLLAQDTFKKLKLTFKQPSKKRVIKRILSLITKLTNSKSTKKILILFNDIEKNEYFIGKIRKALEKKSFDIYSDNMRKSSNHINLKNYFYIDEKVFYKRISGYINDLSKIEDVLDLLDDQDRMRQINNFMKESINEIGKMLLNSNIKCVLAADDHSFNSRVICEAAKRAGIPFYVFIHGYPADPKFRSILPIYADLLLVWNNHQRELISNLVTDKNKVKVFGYPRFDKIKVRELSKYYNENEKLITYVSQPFEEIHENNYSREKMYENLLELKKLGYEINIRLHPKEGKNNSKIQQIENYGFQLSESSLLFDIFSSIYVIGHDSSVLYEANIMKKNAIQLRGEYTNLYFDELPNYTMEDFIYNVANGIDMKGENNLGNSEFLIDDFGTEITRLIFNSQ